MENKKKEIISLLDTMDEEEIDWVFNLINIGFNNREFKIKYSVDTDDQEVKKIWDRVCKVIKAELTEVSYNTWIKDIVPLGIVGDKIKLGAVKEFNKGILEARYTKILKKAMFYVTDRNFDIEFVG